MKAPELGLRRVTAVPSLDSLDIFPAPIARRFVLAAEAGAVEGCVHLHMSSLPFSSRLSRRDALRRVTVALGAAAFSGGLSTFRAIGADAAPGTTAASAPIPEAPPISSESIRGKISLVTGAGGNIALLAGSDGGLLIDSGLVAASAGTLAEIGRLASGPIGILVNTHFHFDHVGGNERVAASGARIVAHENCRKRLSNDQMNEFLGMNMVAAPRNALPVVTFASETTLHFNDEEIRLIPTAPAHTDGDVLVRFEKANVVHLGDLYFHGLYPFIDYSSGGWIGGMAAGAKAALSLVDDQTRIIPGHGPMGTKSDLQSYVAFLETMTERFTQAKSAGKSVDEVVAAAPTKEFDETLGKGFLSPEKFVRCAYTSLLKHA